MSLFATRNTTKHPHIERLRTIIEIDGQQFEIYPGQTITVHMRSHMGDIMVTDVTLVRVG